MSGMSLEDKYDDSPNYYNWVDTYPQLKVLLDNLDVLKADAKLIQTVKKNKKIFMRNSVQFYMLFQVTFLFFALGTAWQICLFSLLFCTNKMFVLFLFLLF